MTGYLRQTLAQIFAELPTISLPPLPDTVVTGISIDSRQTQTGEIYVALLGGSVDGHKFIPMAADRGAVAIVGSQPKPEGLQIPYIQVDDTRVALAWISAAFFRFPARRLTMIGVTGTDGKTTTSNLIFEILLAAGKPAGIISTVNAVINKEVLDTGFHVTTPEAPDVQRYLARMLSAGLTHVVLETTSHGLAQERVTGCEFDLGVVTNITHEHLDYHGSYENYREAKARLFASLSDTREKSTGLTKTAILNKDDASFEFLKEKVLVRQLHYGLYNGADYQAEDIHHLPGGTTFTLKVGDEKVLIRSKLVGLFNVSNTLAAIAATVGGLGISLDQAAAGIANMHGVPGRMEIINKGQEFTAIVDFAHTPNALKSALLTARTLTKGRVIVVFGSAGLRDREKRRLMAEVAVELADISILTAEDPRTESLDGILAEMAVGANARGGVEGKSYFRIADRGQAIREACQMAKPGDLVIACGKGHEQSMCFGETEYMWDDRIAMKAALSELLGIKGPQMPNLPTS